VRLPLAGCHLLTALGFTILVLLALATTMVIGPLV